MPKVSKQPDKLRPFLWHGVDIQWDEGSTKGQAKGNCPFCGADGKLYVSIETGQWDCKTCMAKGNATTFLRQLWAASEKTTDPKALAELAKERKLLSPETLVAWGVRQSCTTRDWIVPGYGPQRDINQLYRYVHLRSENRWALLATPTLNQQLHGVNLYDPKKEEVWLAEGPWDAMALWELMRTTKETTDGYNLTSAETTSLLANANVLAVPGCQTFSDSWSELVAGKRLYILYDNDHPREANGKTVEGAALLGMRKVCETLAKSEGQPSEVYYLRWGKDGYDVDLKHGYDVRDALSSVDGNGKLAATAKDRMPALSWLVARLSPIPEDWVQGRTRQARTAGGVEMECKHCNEWRKLTNAWRLAFKWTEGLDRALSVMLASVTSTKAVGDQLWIKVIGPASSGKSTLCEALSINRKYILAKSTIRGFHSGFKTDRDGEEDNSLIAQLYDKTLITKDGDTLLQAPNRDQILSEARDIYDSTSRTHYRNKTDRDYIGVRMTWLLCGTASLRQLDTSELGERFLDCVIMEGIDDELEDEVLMRVAHRAERSLALESDSSADSQHDPSLVEAMQLTGGYVDYLRKNANSLLASVAFTDDARKRCARLGKFVAFMRARPSSKQEETAEREFGARLVSQLMRLTGCLSVVLNRKTVDDEVMRRVTRCALDTARGRTLELVKHLHAAGQEGIELKTLGLYVNETEEKASVLLRFLRKIGATEFFTRKQIGLSTKPRWRLSARMRALYESAMGIAAPEEADYVAPEETTVITTEEVDPTEPEIRPEDGSDYNV